MINGTNLMIRMLMSRIINKLRNRSLVVRRIFLSIIRFNILKVRIFFATKEPKSIVAVRIVRKKFRFFLSFLNRLS